MELNDLFDYSIAIRTVRNSRCGVNTKIKSLAWQYLLETTQKHILT